MDWKDYFLEIAKIPRPSGKEDQICQYLINFAQKKGFLWESDEAGNLAIDVPATEGYEQQETVILQGHLDMVCVKDKDVAIDFEKDGISVLEEDGWLKAQGTSLGADNGIAIAYGLALCDDDEAAHPPLRLLFTRCEEEGLSGAAALKPEIFSAQRLINLDSEEDGIIYVGCAGGVTLKGTRRVKKENCNLKDDVCCTEIKVSNLPGGHSGCDIHKGYPNAIQELAKALLQIPETSNTFSKETMSIVLFKGGEKHNVIPSSSEIIFFNQLDTNLVNSSIKEYFNAIFPEAILSYENKQQLSSKKSSLKAISHEESSTFLKLLTDLPNGVIQQSLNYENTVETSANVAIVSLEKDDSIEIVISLRSLRADSLKEAKKKVKNIFNQASYDCEESDGYPMWEPKANSPLLEVAKKTYEEKTGKLPQVKVVHAGLECGLFAEKNPSLDMISLGPEMENVHSVRERLNIESAERTYEILKEILKKC